MKYWNRKPGLVPPVSFIPKDLEDVARKKKFKVKGRNNCSWNGELILKYAPEYLEKPTKNDHSHLLFPPLVVKYYFNKKNYNQDGHLIVDGL